MTSKSLNFSIWSKNPKCKPFRLINSSKDTLYDILFCFVNQIVRCFAVQIILQCFSSKHFEDVAFLYINCGIKKAKRWDILNLIKCMERLLKLVFSQGKFWVSDIGESVIKLESHVFFTTELSLVFRTQELSHIPST